MPCCTAALLSCSPGFSGGAVMFFALMIGHAFADFPLQGEFISRAKNRHADISQLLGGKPAPASLWAQVLTAHTFIHGGMVWMITGSVALAAIEAILHWWIDFAKCEQWTNFTVDQLLHTLCKAGYAILLACQLPWVTWTP